MRQSEHEPEDQTFVVDPSLAVAATLAEMELLRLETEIALAQLGPLERDESLMRDMSPLGR
jgi:hypothetical protein